MENWRREKGSREKKGNNLPKMMANKIIKKTRFFSGIQRIVRLF